MLQKQDSVRSTALAVVVFYGLVACLNGEALLRNAELLPYSRYRAIMVKLAQPFAGIARQGPGRLRARLAQGREWYWEGVQ